MYKSYVFILNTKYFCLHFVVIVVNYLYWSHCDSAYAAPMYLIQCIYIYIHHKTNICVGLSYVKLVSHVMC